jgi:hypothetical protein
MHKTLHLMTRLQEHEKIIKYKEAAQLTLLILNEEGEIEADIDYLFDGPCPSCEAENDYLKTILLKEN